MLEDTKKERVIAITSYCDTEEKLNVLIVNISLIRSYFPNYKIALHANHPLEQPIQKLVDMYFYEDLNHTEEDKWIYYWNIISENGVDPFNKKFFYSIRDTGFSVFQQIKALTKYLIDYKWVMLINYDTSVEEIQPNDYREDFDLTVHYFPDHKAYSLIMMFFNPRVFYEKVAKNFTYDNWMKPLRVDQLNEERFLDIVKESYISHLALDYKVSDKVSGEPDYLKPNAPENRYFEYYLLYRNEDELEIYLWGVKQGIVEVVGYDEHEKYYKFTNENSNEAFNCTINTSSDKFSTFTIVSINNEPADIVLKIKKGYTTRPI